MVESRTEIPSINRDLFLRILERDGVIKREFSKEDYCVQLYDVLIGCKGAYTYATFGSPYISEKAAEIAVEEFCKDIGAIKPFERVENFEGLDEEQRICKYAVVPRSYRLSIL